MSSQSSHVAAVIMPSCVLQKESDADVGTSALGVMEGSVYAVRDAATGAMHTQCPLLEMQRWKARNTSWLFTTTRVKEQEEEEDVMRVMKKKAVGDYLEQDGSLFLMTRIDAVFVFLPALEAAQADGYQSAEQITELVGRGGQMNAMSDLLRCVCDVKLAGDSEFFRLSDAKTIAWLDCKLRKLMHFMERHAEESVRALDEVALRLYCINILSEWVSDAWIAWLKRLHNVQEDAALERAINAVPDAYMGAGSAEKNTSAAINEQTNRAKKMEEGRRKSNIEKNAKAAKGTKSLLSFFGGGAKR